MEKAMAPHSSTLAWKIPWTEKPGRLPSMGSLRVGHDWAASLSLSTFFSFFFFTRQQKRHWCIEQSFGLCGRGWDDLGEWHWNMYNIIHEANHQSRFNAWYWMLGAGALGRPKGMVWGGRKEEGSGWGTHVYLWQIHFDIRQNQYNIVKLKNKKKGSVWKELGVICRI